MFNVFKYLCKVQSALGNSADKDIAQSNYWQMKFQN